MNKGSNFVNFSNHPSTRWSTIQVEEAYKMIAPPEGELSGDIISVPFPNVCPWATSEELDLMADEQVAMIMQHDPKVAMVAGQPCLVFRVVVKLQRLGVQVVSATSERNTIDLGNGEKKVEFVFTQFRSFPDIDDQGSDNTIPGVLLVESPRA